MVPPALREVGKLVLQTVLQELKHHADDHTHPPVSDHKCLTEEGREMGDVNVVAFCKQLPTTVYDVVILPTLPLIQY